jgi:hypothetical protein
MNLKTCNLFISKPGILRFMESLLSFFACVRTLNRWPSGVGRKAPINQTHFRRFARFGDARRSRSVWTACVFNAAFPMQTAIRWLGRFMEIPLPLLRMQRGLAPEDGRTPLNTYAGLASSR